MKIRLHEVDQRHSVRDYVLSRLQDGGALSRVVFKHVVGWKWRSFALLPADVLELRQPLSDGNVCAGADTIQPMVWLLASELLLHRRALILEHQLARRHDPILSTFAIRPAYLQNEVLVILDQSGTSHHLIEKSISDCFSAAGFAAFIVGSERPNVDEKEDLIDVEEVCSSIEAVVVDLFDGESFLIFQRDDT